MTLESIKTEAVAAGKSLFLGSWPCIPTLGAL